MLKSFVVKPVLCGVVAVWTVIVSGARPQAALPTEGRALAGDLEDLFVVGREAGDDHEMLFGLVDVAFAPDGELYILEEHNHRVVVYGPEGDFRRMFGREGQGPGEFQLPMTLAVTDAGEIAIWDFQNTAYLLFDRAGKYLRNVGGGDWQRGPRRASLRPWPGGGVAYLPTLVHERTDPPELIDRGAVLRDPLAARVAPTELLAVHHPRRRGKEVAGVLELTNGAVFSPMTRWDVVSDGRIAVVDEVAYRVRLVRPDDGSETLIVRDIAPRAVTEADRERQRDKKRTQYERPAGGASFGGSGSGRVTPQAIGSIVAAMEFADVIPVIRDLRVDKRDRLWIQRYGETYEDPGPIDIVASDGVYVGTLPAMPMPDAFGPQGMVAWMENGRDVELERVVVRRLPDILR